MQNVINLICGDATTFTPQMVCALVMFCMVLECITSICKSLMKVGE